MRSQTELWLASEHFMQLVERYAQRLNALPVDSPDRPLVYLMATRYANFVEALRWAQGEPTAFVNLPPEDRLPIDLRET